MGDLNAIKSISEKHGGCQNFNPANKEFKNFINDRRLVDMAYVGPAFTWSNGAVTEDPIFGRLDRVLCTTDWLFMFPDNGVLHLPRVSSDHAPILINTHRTNKRKKRFSYKIEYYWVEHPEFSDIVQRAWNSNHNNTLLKIDEVGKDLSKWSKKEFGNIFRVVEETKNQLLQVQSEAHIRDTRAEEKEMCMKIDNLNTMQHNYYEQRSKVKWISNMDKSTRTFHLSVIQRRKKNQIVALKNPEGQWITDADGVVNQLVNHFTTLFRRDPNEDKYAMLFQAESFIINTNNSLLVVVPHSEEIWTTIKRMKSLKSPGPDGTPSLFYKRCWELIGGNVIKTVQDCFNSASLPPGMNHTNLVLIPKVKKPTVPSDYRPLALTNILYKVVTKILAQRLKGHLNQLVDTAQSPFIPGRLIIDNIVTSNEIIHSMSHSKSILGAFALKIDISKAY